MTTPFWFNRMAEYWGIPQHLDLVEHTRRARLQVLQLGDFGPMFYGMADDPQVPRHWVSMPLVGVRENLAYVADLFPQLHEAGARIVAQLSLSWHYGDHETGKGLWSSWENIWTPDLLGPAPCDSPSAAMEQVAGGTLRCWPIPDRPYRTYSGCCCNPHWRAMLQAMVSKALQLGVDGFMAHHNFTNFCRCQYCRARMIPVLGRVFSGAQLKELYGHTDPAQVEDLLMPLPSCPAPLRQRFDLELLREVHLRRKELFDEIFIHHARAIKPDLLLSQWYHKYDFGPGDERSLLPTALWAKDEDYIWYSQGGHKGRSAIAKGYLADMGLPARFTHAAGHGRPFIINKYDSRRLRLSIAETAAHGGASLAFHLPEISAQGISRDEYYAPIVRYHRFMADRDPLYHPATPYSQLALVYPRRAELEAEADSIEPLKRLGRILEDDHWLFDIITDEQLIEKGSAYQALILPGLQRLSREEGAWLEAYVARGGKVLFTGSTGNLLPDGSPNPGCPLAAWKPGHAGTLYLENGPWKPELREIAPGIEMPVFPLPEQDEYARQFLDQWRQLCSPSWLHTDAPWYVRTRAWKPEQTEAIVLHWVNYHQDEQSLIEVPLPTGAIQTELQLPAGGEVDRVEWHYPEMREALTLAHAASQGRVSFTIPSLIVYGLSVVHLK
ncbi:MAG: hypothetical protein EXS58_10770 [Candidatus Latescibacteria bacterium]|nr:hypothetical protein [Candidatus Latescibacterota bacterium]